MYHGIIHLLFFYFYISSFLFTASTPEETTPSQTVGTIITTGMVPVSSNIQPTTNLPSDGTTTTSVIIVVAVVIILVVIVVGVVILVVLFRAKKRKQKLEVNNFQNVTMGSELKQKDTTGKGASSKPVQPLYEVMQKEVPLAVPSKLEYLNQTCSLSEYKLVPANSDYAVNAKFPRVVNLPVGRAGVQPYVSEYGPTPWSSQHCN